MLSSSTVSGWFLLFAQWSLVEAAASTFGLARYGPAALEQVAASNEGSCSTKARGQPLVA